MRKRDTASTYTALTCLGTLRELLIPEASTLIDLLDLLGLHGNAINLLNVSPVGSKHLLQSDTTQGCNLSSHMNHLPWLREPVAVKRFGEPCWQKVRCISLKQESTQGNSLCHLVHCLCIFIGDHCRQAYLAPREQLQLTRIQLHPMNLHRPANVNKNVFRGN